MCFLHLLLNAIKLRKIIPETPINHSNETPNAKIQLQGKKGIGYTLRAIGEQGSWVENLPKIIELRVSWNYSWGSNSILFQPQFIEFLPMIWGFYGVEQALQVEVQRVKELQNPPLLLAFNEPDHEDQSNLSVEQALSVWHILESSNFPLVSPSCANPLGEWMKDFMEESSKRNYRVDVVGVHDYGGTNPRAFQTTMKTIYELYQKPILITEFAPADWHATTPEENCHSPHDVLEFMKVVLPWMESQSWIIGYAWFPFSFDSPVGTCSALYGKNGKLTDCGKFYALFDPQGKKKTRKGIWTALRD